MPATAAGATFEEIAPDAPLPVYTHVPDGEVNLGMPSKGNDTDIVNIPDPVVRDVVVAYLRPQDPNAITVAEMRTMQTFYAEGVNGTITDLTGLEYSPGLEVVDIRGHNVTSLNPLRNMQEMVQIKADHNPGLVDISAVASMPKLTWLGVNYTPLNSLEALRGHEKIGFLQIVGTDVTSLDPLSGATGLYDIYFQDSDISSVEGLRGLPRLSTVSAPRANLSSIEPLKGSPQLELLNIANNRVSDLSPIGTMPKLKRVGFTGQVVDGPAVLVPAGAGEYTKIDVADSFAMAYDQRQQVTDLVDEITPDGEGGIWRGIDENTESVQAFVSKPIVPGGPLFSATITYPIERAMFTNVAPTQPRLETEYSFAFTTTPGFIDYSALGTDANLFTLLSGEIPGLTLGADGVLAGTPTELGSFEITVRATDKHGNVIDQTYTIVVGEKIIDVDPPIVDPVDPPVDPPVKPVPPVKPAPDLAETGSALAPFLASVAGLALLTGVVALLLGRRSKRN